MNYPVLANRIPLPKGKAVEKKPPGWHSKLSPSGLHANFLCKGRYNANRVLKPRPSNRDALIGTCAHELFEKLLIGEFPDRDIQSYETYKDEAGTVIDGENMQLVVETYRYVQQLLVIHPDAVLYAELRVEPGFQYNGEYICSGTADVVVVIPSINTIWVLDYKNGVIPVEVTNNYQLAAYALGVYNMFKDVIRIDTILTGVLQPRTFHVDGNYRFWQFEPIEFTTNWIPAINNIINHSMSNTTERHASEEACRWCNALPTCPEAARKGLEEAAMVFGKVSEQTLPQVKTNVLVDPQTLNDDQIKTILDVSGFISVWLNDVKHYAEVRFSKNKPIPGYKMVHGRGSRKWSVEDPDQFIKEISTFINLMNSHYYNQKLKSPAQFENSVKRLLTKEQWKKVETQYIKKTRGSATLVPLHDKRPSIGSIDEAKTVFEVVKPQPTGMDFLD